MQPKKEKFYGWILVAVLFVIYLCNMGFPMYGGNILNSLMVNDPSMHINKSILGTGFSLFILIPGLCGPIIGGVVVRRGGKFCMVIGSLFIITAGIFMGIFVRNPITYILGYGILMGIGSGFGSKIPIQQVVSMWFYHKRALAMSIVVTAAGLGGFFAPVIMNFVIGFFKGNWRPAWFFIGAVGAVTLLLDLLFVKNMPSDLNQVPDGATIDESNRRATKMLPTYREPKFESHRAIMHTASFWRIVLCTMGFMVPYNLCVSHGIIHFTSLGYSSEIAASAISVMSLSSIVGRMLPSFLDTKMSDRFISSIFMVSTALGSIFALMASKNIAFVYLFAVFMGGGAGAGFVCPTMMTSRIFGTAYFAQISGIIQSATSLASALVPILAGMIFDTTGSYTIVFLLSCVLSLVGLYASIRCKNPSLIVDTGTTFDQFAQ